MKCSLSPTKTKPPTRYWIPLKKSQVVAEKALEDFQAWVGRCTSAAKSVGGCGFLPARSWISGYQMVAVQFEVAPDPTVWVKYRSRHSDTSYTIKQRVAKERLTDAILKVRQAINEDRCQPAEALRQEFAPKSQLKYSIVFQQLGVERVGTTVVLIESFGWDLRNCRRISDVQYEQLVARAKVASRRRRKKL